MKTLALAAALSVAASVASAAQVVIVAVDSNFDSIGEPELLDLPGLRCGAAFVVAEQLLREDIPDIDGTFITQEDGVKMYLFTSDLAPNNVAMLCVE